MPDRPVSGQLVNLCDSLSGILMQASLLSLCRRKGARRGTGDGIAVRRHCVGTYKMGGESNEFTSRLQAWWHRRCFKKDVLFAALTEKKVLRTGH